MAEAREFTRTDILELVFRTAGMPNLCGCRYTPFHLAGNLTAIEPALHVDIREALERVSPETVEMYDRIINPETLAKLIKGREAAMN